MLGEKLGIVNKRISKQSKSRGANVIVRSIVKREFKKRGMQRRASFAEGVEGGEKPQSSPSADGEIPYRRALRIG